MVGLPWHPIISMIESFQFVIRRLLELGLVANLNERFPEDPNALLSESGSILDMINSAFLVCLAGHHHPRFEQASHCLEQLSYDSTWGAIAQFYSNGIQRIGAEVQTRMEQDRGFVERLNALHQRLDSPDSETDSPDALTEATWSVFFPEGVGIRGQESERVKELRDRRTVTVRELNPTPLESPGRQLMLTSNALLTIPLRTSAWEQLDELAELREELSAVINEAQRYWYDHPIPIGVKPENNEILYGLRALNEAVAFEHQRGTVSDEPVTCVLSVSVTHQGLQSIAKPYLRGVLSGDRSLEHLKIYAFTEADTQALIQQVLRPAIHHYLPDARELDGLTVFGVDGRYGRHYSFLKAIAALWQVLVDSQIQGTFKIDLDQVFPQDELVEQTGKSAFEHVCTPLWGAKGTDAQGQTVDLGMLAGALVNQKDIHRGLFTVDVPFPSRSPQADEYVFFSPLPQALSTEAEMMTRYGTQENEADSGERMPDGEHTCIQRIHVTGGTNGILVDRLREYRPFTPSFVGRAEDQAYLFSVLTHPDTPLRYVHEPGLIMRHDKEGFAQEAIKLAKIGKLIGDYERILLFSAYARVLTEDVDELKAEVDPFTGCFVSQLPVTVTSLRFALKAAALFEAGAHQEAQELIKIGVPRLVETLAYIDGETSELAQDYEVEQREWQVFYDVLDALEEAIAQGEPIAIGFQEKAIAIIQSCHVG